MYPFSVPTVIKLEFSRQIFEKYINIKFHQENLSSGSRVVPWGQTDRPDEAGSSFSQFCERPKDEGDGPHTPRFHPL